MGEERRKYPRIPVNAFVRFYEEALDTSRQQYLQGTIKNYSSGGIRILTKHLLPKSSVITIELPIETEAGNFTIVQIRGVVRWVERLADRWGIGIELFELKGPENQQFIDLMTSLTE